MMTRPLVLTGAALLIAGILYGGAFAEPDDYLFEPVQAEIKTSMAATIAVRLIHKTTKKPIIGAAIVQSRLYMPAEPGHPHRMVSGIVYLPHSEPGMYAFKAPLTMEGRWLLSIAANVQDEPKPVVGEITFRVTR